MITRKTKIISSIIAGLLIFYLNDDISEQNDLSAQRTGIALRLLDELKAWTAEVHAPVPTVLNER